VSSTAWIALSATLVLALSVGLALGRAWTKRAVRVSDATTVAELLHKVVHFSHNGTVVLNAWGDVILFNPRAVELGVVVDNRVDERARAAAEEAVRTGEVIDVDLSPMDFSRAQPAGRRPQAVFGEVRRLSGEFTVIDVNDESDSVRLEATRRDFVANVSHELKTPVGALALLAEAVIDSVDDPEQAQNFAGKILREANRLGALVTELIALSRLQGAEQLPDLDTVGVDDVVEEALGRSRSNAELAQIDITTDESSTLVVMGDRTLLVTALSNLIDNAVAYSPPGTPVSISRRQSGDFVEIAVTDRGIGIAPRHQVRVFERFFRVDKARSRATGGTGLGLAIVKHVAANHGGTVKLWSQQGVGSTFTLVIPLEQTATEESGQSQLTDASIESGGTL
jgi:two-component system sensor histidine kinase SenX3